MPRRAIILIVGFWAFLTIITPTLVLWSKSAAEGLKSSDEERVETKGRKVMGYSERFNWTFSPPSLPPPLSTTPSPSPSPSSAASSPSASSLPFPPQRVLVTLD